MFETIDKAKQLGVLGLERIGDYLELLRIEAEIQGRDISERLVSLAIMGFFVLLALLFLGLAVIVSYWDTPYRILAAWLVCAAYTAAATLCYAFGRRRKPAESALKVLREELQQDVQLLKDLL